MSPGGKVILHEESALKEFALRKFGKAKRKRLLMRRPDVRATLAADGFILVAVLWILAALAALASVYSIYIANTAISARAYDNRLPTEALITAGLELTAFRVIGFDDATRPSSGAFAFQIGGSDIGVEFHSEGARIDLNMAPKPLLSGLLAALGAKPNDAILLRTISLPGGQSRHQEAQTRKPTPTRMRVWIISPRQAPFQSAAELRLVRDSRRHSWTPLFPL